MGFFSSDESNPCGLYNLEHLIVILICFALIFALIIITIRLPKESIEKIIKIIAILIFTLEILKIIWNIANGRSEKLDTFLPLYFCSLFIYALIAASFFKGKAKEAGLIFLFYGGIVGGTAFLIYPSTSLLIFPMWHFLTIHSMIYHSLMIYVGLIIVLKGIFVPNRKYFIPYFIFTTIFCLIALIINYIFPGNNLMFVKEPLKGTILVLIGKISGIFYPAVIIIGQNAGTFAVSHFGYELIMKIKSHKNKQKNLQ